MILQCTGCKTHDFQDERYGHNMRVHNKFPQGDATMWRCTICNKERTEGKKEDKHGKK